jgi:hypothetical protein
MSSSCEYSLPCWQCKSPLCYECCHHDQLMNQIDALYPQEMTMLYMFLLGFITLMCIVFALDVYKGPYENKKQPRYVFVHHIIQRRHSI